MNSGKVKSLLDWLKSTGVEEPIENLRQLSDGVVLFKIIKCMQLDDLPSIPEKPLQFVKEFLEASSFGYAVSHIFWDSLTQGNEFEIAKVVLLLLSMTISCPNKDKLILEMTTLDLESQIHIRHILSEALSEGISNFGQNLFDVLLQKAPPPEQADIDCMESLSRNTSLINASSMNSLSGSPVQSINRPVPARDPFKTPVKPTLKTMEDEEVYFSVPASCPPLRRGASSRHSIQDYSSYPAVFEGSPVQEFLSSPDVSYKIKIKNLEQKVVVLEKNLHAERLAKEDCEKNFLDKQTALEQSERRLRDMSRFSLEKQQLLDEIDELHALKLERDALEKENSKLKLRLEKYDSYSFDSRDLKKDLDLQLKENEELSRQIQSLRSSLNVACKNEKHTIDLEESIKSLQDTNSVQEQEISHLLTQLHKLKMQNLEQKEHYEARIYEYKSIIEDKDSSALESKGESMGIILEHKIAELQETLKEMEENWIRPDVGVKLQADYDAARETLKKYQEKLAATSRGKMELDDEMGRLREEVRMKDDEIADCFRKMASANHKVKSLETANKLLQAQSETLTNDKECLKKRVKEIEAEVCCSNSKMRCLQSELELIKNENESKDISIQSQQSRLNELNQKVAELKQKCRALETNLVEKTEELDTMIQAHSSTLASLESLQQKLERINQDFIVSKRAQEILETEVTKLQEIQREMEDNWIRPDAGEKLQADCDVIKERLEDYQEKLTSANCEKTALEVEICRLREEITTKDNKVTDCCTKIDSANQRVESLENANQVLQVQSATLASDKECQKKRIEELESEVSSSNNKICLLQSELELIKDENDNKAISIQSHMTRLCEANQSVTDYKQRCQTLESCLDEKSKALNAMTEANASTMQKMEGIQQDSAGMKREQEALKSEVERLRADMQARVSQLSPSDVAKLETDYSTAKKNLAKYQEKLSAADCEKITLEERITAKEDEIADCFQKMASANHKIESLETTNQTLQAKTDTLSSDKEYLEKRIAELEGKVCSSNNKISSLQSELESIKDENESKAASIQSHMSRFSESGQKISELRKKCQTLEVNFSKKSEELDAATKTHLSTLASLELSQQKLQGVQQDLTESERVRGVLESELQVSAEERNFYEVRCSQMQQELRETLDKFFLTQQDFEKEQEKYSNLQVEIEAMRTHRNNSEEKLRAIRAQFTEKYREKQEKVFKLERDLKEWQVRADDETNKYDSLSAMYNEKRAQLDDTKTSLGQAREENLDLQEAIRNLKMKNEVLTTSSTQLNVKQLEEEKKIRSLTAEVQRLTAQLQFADRRICELSTGTKSFRHSSNIPDLMPVAEARTVSGRQSLGVYEDDAFCNDRVFRCRSDTCLDSPATANRKCNDRSTALNDSLDDILRTPSTLQTGQHESLDNVQADSYMNASFSTNRSRLSMETSFVGESPSRKTHFRPRFASHQELSSSHKSRSTDVNFNTSNPDLVFVENTPNANSGRRFMSRHPTSLDHRRQFPSNTDVVEIDATPSNPAVLAQTFQTEEEPEDYEFGSLSRLAELQRRNAATLPHLKSSYPIETQGKTPSRCDENVRIGDAEGTLRRMSLTSAALQRAINFKDVKQRHISADNLSSRVLRNSPAEMELSENFDSQETSGNPAESHWQSTIPVTEEKEQVNPKRMSMMFEIANSPIRPQLRSRASRKQQLDKFRQKLGPDSSSEQKIPDKGKKTPKKTVDEKRRGTSLMDRVKRPLGKFTAKK